MSATTPVSFTARCALTAPTGHPLARIRVPARQASRPVPTFLRLWSGRAEGRYFDDLLGKEEPRRFSFTTEEGETINVDEPLTVQGLSTPKLALTTRIEWTALCWLCWAAGLDKIALPTHITSPLELHAGLIIVTEREAALSAPDPSPNSEPHFHSLDETLLPASTLTHLAAHYREIRAVLLFASDPECQSPWQDDLGRN